MNKTCFILLYLLIGLFTMSIKAQQTGSDSAFVLMDTIITYDSETMTEEIKVVKNLVYYQVDTIPIFRLCELDPKPLECSKKYLLDCMYNFIQYPDTAKKSKIQGVVYATFIVDKQGQRILPKITRSLGYGCDEEVLRFISVLPPMLPARRRGVPVHYEYIMPVKFQLKK
ncbi:MAG: energy transducer TonB [Saprospiraceae bacterium]|nr:energy transducer TonB [Saprospiraceae bacterium]MBK7809756.1 energy transducer TonB [Saprospiraceae bacterium]MBK9632133.1 energy transducer TonB [Saprospiraceae bacterium]